MQKFLLTGILSFFLLSLVQAQDTTHLKGVTVKGLKKTIKTDSLSASLKTDSRLLEIPQSIVSVSNDLLQLQGGFELRDAFRNSSSVYLGASDNVFSGAGNINIRGLSAASVSRNGMPGNSAYGNTEEDESFIEKVEILKGPAGFLSSFGEPGGSVNVVTKAPKTTRIFNVTLTGGSFSFYRAAIDVGSVLKDKGFSARLNAAYETRRYYADFLERNKFALAPVVQYNFSKRTSLLAEYNMVLSKAKNGAHFTKSGYDSTLHRDRWANNYMADPGLPVSSSNDHTGRLVFRHSFSDRWKMTVQSSYKDAPFEIWTMYNSTSYKPVQFNEQGKGNRSSFHNVRQNKSISTQLFVNGQFNTGKHIVHKLLTGAEWANSRDSILQGAGAKAFPFDLYDLHYGENTDSLRRPSTTKLFTYGRRYNWHAAYLYDAITFYDRLIVGFGARITWYKAEARSRTAPAYKVSSERNISPRLGITYLLRPDMSVFGIFDKSFQPQTGFDPLVSNNLEIGVKKDWFEGKLATSAAAYMIRRDNMISVNLQGEVTQLGQVKSQGIEVDVLGEIGKGLTVSANYTLMDVSQSKDENPEVQGRRYLYNPRQQHNVWIAYAFQRGLLSGWNISLGESSVAQRSTSDRTTMKGYTKLDGSVGYDTGKFFARLLLDNLTNSRYIAAGDRSGGIWAYQESVPFNFKIQAGIRL